MALSCVFHRLSPTVILPLLSCHIFVCSHVCLHVCVVCVYIVFLCVSALQDTRAFLLLVDLHVHVFGVSQVQPFVGIDAFLEN